MPMEYAFELALCAALEQSERVVSRQHGGAVVAAGSRIVDICLLEPGPEFNDRAAITDQTIPALAIEADIGPGEAIPAREAFDIRPDRRADIVERACEVGYLTRERRGGTTIVRATTRYPDEWFGRLVAIENKPDLDRAGDLQVTTPVRRYTGAVRCRRPRDRIIRHPGSPESHPRPGWCVAIRPRHRRERRDSPGSPEKSGYTGRRDQRRAAASN